jgi:2,3-dihydroxybiphenyl 1,2-dioxygenase
MSEIQCLGYIGVGATDLGAWERYATEVVGLEIGGREDDTLLLRMDEHRFRIAVHQSETEDVLYLGWEVTDEASLGRLESNLRRANVECRRGTVAECRQRQVVDMVTFRDPDGLLHEAHVGALVLTDRPFRSPLAVSGFETGTQGLGHAFLSVRSYDKSLSFFREVLGFRVSDYIEMPPIPSVPPGAPPMTFLHCGTGRVRHHSLALATFPGPKRLNHLMLQVRTVDEVGRAFYRAQEKNVPMIMSLGRHSNDRMFSFYMDSPSGVAVEYGYGGIDIEDETWVVKMHRTADEWGHAPMAGLIAQMQAAAVAASSTSPRGGT